MVFSWALTRYMGQSGPAMRSKAEQGQHQNLNWLLGVACFGNRLPSRDWTADCCSAFLSRGTSRIAYIAPVKPVVATHIDTMAAPAMSIRSPLVRALHAVPVTRASAPRSAPFVGRPALPMRKVGKGSLDENAGVPEGIDTSTQMCPMMIMTRG